LKYSHKFESAEFLKSKDHLKKQVTHFDEIMKLHWITKGKVILP